MSGSDRLASALPSPVAPETRASRSWAMRGLKAFGATLAVVAAIAGGWACYLRLTGNFHAVEEGILYRSAQLSEAQFASHIREKGIRSILNLRGNNAGSAWYDEEMEASTAAGIRHVDYPISARRDLTDGEVSEIVSLLRDLPRPVLVHCEAGADRSGLVAAIYEFVFRKQPADEAAEQLSFRFGHFPWLGNRTVAMDRTFERITSGRFDDKLTD